MSNYTRITDFSAKDALATGNPSKIILGAEHQAEFDSIATHVATKQDGINTLSTETAIVAADALSFYDDSAGSHKKITYANLKIGMGTYLMDTEVQQVYSTSPVVAGFSAASNNQMAGYGNCTETIDRGGLATNWKITPGASHLGTWLIGFQVTLVPSATWAVGSVQRAGITRYDSGGTGLARYYLQQQSGDGGTQHLFMSGTTIHNISDATHYFTIDTYSSADIYSVNTVYLWGWRIR